jgi:Ca-activated chloride channel homolog
MSPRRYLSHCGTVMLAALLLTALQVGPARRALAGQRSSESLTVKIDVNLVTLDAVVRGPDGAAPTDLREQDFTVFDNGVAQQITHFSHAQLPLAVALVVDRSPSIAEYLRELRTVALAALKRLKPSDQVALFSFDVCPNRMLGLTDNREQAARILKEIKVGVGTNIFGAVISAAKYLRAAAPDRHRAIILISDNVPNVFQFDESDAAREVLESGATLCSIRTPGTNPPAQPDVFVPTLIGRGVIDPKAVDRIAAQSGGEVLNLGTARQLSDALDSAILNLRLAYTIGFIPSNLGPGGAYHRLAVKIATGRCPACRVQARADYYVATRGSEPPPESSADAVCYDCEAAVASEYLRSPYAAVPTAGGIPFDAHADQAKNESDLSTVRLQLKIPTRYITSLMGGGGRTGRLLVAAFPMDGEGNRLGEEWRTLDLQLTEETYREYAKSGIPFSIVVPQGQKFRIFVYDLRSRRYGMKLIRLRS